MLCTAPSFYDVLLSHSEHTLLYPPVLVQPEGQVAQGCLGPHFSLKRSKNHRIVLLEGTLNPIHSNPPPMGRAAT